MTKAQTNPQMGLSFKDAWTSVMKTQERLDELRRRIGEVHNSIGGLTEAMVGAGFCVVKLTGENADLCPPPEGFKPKEW